MGPGPKSGMCNTKVSLEISSSKLFDWHLFLKENLWRCTLHIVNILIIETINNQTRTKHVWSRALSRLADFLGDQTFPPLPNLKWLKIAAFYNLLHTTPCHWASDLERECKIGNRATPVSPKHLSSMSFSQISQIWYVIQNILCGDQTTSHQYLSHNITHQITIEAFFSSNCIRRLP